MDGDWFAGAVVGVLVDAAPPRPTRNASPGSAGGAWPRCAAVAASYRRPPSPLVSSGRLRRLFFLRWSAIVAGRRGCVCVGNRAGRRRHWSPLTQLGRTSLFIYWIHVEMVRPDLATAAPRAVAAGGVRRLRAFCGFMLACSIPEGAAVVERYARWPGKELKAGVEPAATAAPGRHADRPSAE